MAVFAASVAVMDVRLLGARGAIPIELVRTPRRVAMVAFAALAFSGFVLFSAEASHLVLNPVFLVKMSLVALALLNVLAFERAFRRGSSSESGSVRAIAVTALISLALWFAVVVAGRSIAYY
jgi:hypothetical protein